MYICSVRIIYILKVIQPFTQHSSTSVARSRGNVHLNRYNNVAPYDEHRVVLSQFEHNDYINASIARGVADPDDQFYILGNFF